MVVALTKGVVDITRTATPYLIQDVLKGSENVAILGETATPIYSLIVKPEINSDATEARVRWTIPQKAPEPLPEGAQPSNAKIVEARFEDADLQVGDTAWVAGRFSGLDESMAQFLLERLRPDGSWAEVGRATSTIRDGRARAGLLLTSDGKD